MIRVEPLPNGIGARIRGIDLRNPLSDSDFEEIESAWNAYHALVFSDQTDLPLEAQVNLVARFGPVIEERVPGEKHSFVSNEDGRGTDEMNDGYREGPLTAHMDYTYTPYPADVISLYAMAIPEGGSETLFYSNVAPLERMPESLRAELASYHIFCAHDLAAMKPDARLYLEPRTDPRAPTQSHTWPLVRRHPHKPGVEALMCTLQQTERILELEDAATDDRASRAKLAEIFDDHLYVPANEYAHVWQPDELIVWDNIALQHARAECPRTRGARSFRRVAACAAGNAIHETVAFLDLADSTEAFA